MILELCKGGRRIDRGKRVTNRRGRGTSSVREFGDTIKRSILRKSLGNRSRRGERD